MFLGNTLFSIKFPLLRFGEAFKPAGRFHIYEYQGFTKLFYGDTDYPSQSQAIELSQFEQNKWTHLVVVKKSETAKVYLNGLLIKSDIILSDILKSKTTIGWDNYSNRFYKGKNDDVRIFGRALAVKKVKELFEL